VLTLLQQLLEPADTANYGRMLVRHPPEGVTAKHVFLSRGSSTTTPDGDNRCAGRGHRPPLAGEVIHPVAGLDLAGLPAPQVPLPLAAT